MKSGEVMQGALASASEARDMLVVVRLPSLVRRQGSRLESGDEDEMGDGKPPESRSGRGASVQRLG